MHVHRDAWNMQLHNYIFFLHFYSLHIPAFSIFHNIYINTGVRLAVTADHIRNIGGTLVFLVVLTVITASEAVSGLLLLISVCIHWSWLGFWFGTGTLLAGHKKKKNLISVTFDSDFFDDITKGHQPWIDPIVPDISNSPNAQIFIIILISEPPRNPLSFPLDVSSLHDPLLSRVVMIWLIGFSSIPIPELLFPSVLPWGSSPVSLV